MGDGQAALGVTGARSAILTPELTAAHIAQARRLVLDWRGWLGLTMLGCVAVLIWRKQ
jgi:hypothetical protein